MTFVGKLLIVVLMGLCVMFMAFAGAVFTVQQSWKTAHQLANEQLGNQKKDFDLLDEQSKKFRDEAGKQITNLENRAVTAENTVRTQETEIKNISDELDTEKGKSSTQQAVAGIAEDEAQERKKETLLQREKNQGLYNELNEATDKVRTLEDEVFADQLEAKNLKQRYERLLVEYSQIRNFVREQGLEFDPQKYVRQQTPPPQVEGVVESTKKTDRGGSLLVEISIGSDDGLVEGHKLVVYRPGTQPADQPKYLGEIRIVLVTPDRSVGELIERAKNGVVTKGDNVTTKL